MAAAKICGKHRRWRWRRRKHLAHLNGSRRAGGA